MIDILMAVYNGEKYLAEQIDSILCQTVQDYRLIICDDGSSDSSFDIAAKYSKKYPGLIDVSRNNPPTGSARGNFMKMLKSSSADYVMFADQDDFWHCDKIRLTFEKMKELEGEFPDSPVLVHTELEIADSELNMISPSFTRFQGLDPHYNTLNRLLCQNNITGCTVMINKALAELVKDVPAKNMLMHDWWIGLAAASFGHIGFVDKSTVKYRQHSGNQLGAVNNRSIKGAVKIVRERTRSEKRVSVTYSQAEAFAKCFGDMLPHEMRDILNIYTDIPNHCKAVRLYKLLKYGFLKQNFMTAVGQLIFC